MTEQDFRKHISENPDDWLTYLAYADWLEENTRSNAISDALRYMGTEKRRPQLSRIEPRPWLWTRRVSYGNEAIIIPQLVPHTDLPDSIADRMGIPKHGVIQDSLEVGLGRYATWEDAVLSLATALDKEMMDPPPVLDFDIGNTIDETSGVVNQAPFPEDWGKFFEEKPTISVKEILPPGVKPSDLV